MTQPPKITKKTLQSLLLGTALGDAFGAGIEFQDRNWIRKNVDFTQFINARNQIQVPPQQLEAFTKNYHPWDYTDDTEMTIGTIKALMSNEPFTEELLLRKWTEEYNQGIKEKGYGRNGHGSMRWYYAGEKTIKEIQDFQRHRPNPGNAPAMRSAPLGLIHESRINAYAEINARATHPNIQAILSSQCIARASEYIVVKNGDPTDVIAYCQQTIPLNQDYKEYLHQVEQLPTYENLGHKEFIILCGPQPIQEPYFLPGIHGCPSDSKFTTGCVLYILKHSQNAFDALKKSIYLGGDVDSIASITTGILAARDGLENIPPYMLENLAEIQYLSAIAEEWTNSPSPHAPHLTIFTKPNI